MGEAINGLDDVPENAAEAFRQYADEEFGGNRNMALRELIVREKLRSEVRSIEADLREEIQQIRQRLIDLEADEGSNKPTINDDKFAG